MLKFFRKIRQRLIGEGKLNRYLIYTVGEIFLIVCGILIALQINNWNEDKKNRKMELLLLTEMKKNLLKDLDDIKWNIEKNNIFIKSNQTILSHLETQTSYHDSLEYHYGNIVGNTQLVENTSAYENLRSLGFNLISNDSLRISITNLYGRQYDFIENFERNVDDRFQWDNLYPEYRRNVKLFKLWKKGTPFSPEALMANNDFKESIKMNMELRAFAVGLYTGIERDIGVIISLIDAELHK